MKEFCRTRAGFTLVELIIVIVIIGIIALVVVPKLSIDGFDDDAELTRFMTGAKYARHRSMVTGGDWGVVLNVGAGSYTVVDDTGAAAELPSGRANPTVLENGLAVNIVSGQTLDNSAISFNSMGQPIVNTTANDLLTGQVQITIAGRTIIIEPNTGGIYEQ